MDGLTKELVRSEVHKRLLRFLFASSAGLEERFLTPEEKSAARDLEAAGVIAREAGGRLIVDRVGEGTSTLTEQLLRANDDSPAAGEGRIERAPVEPPELASILLFLQQLTGAVGRSTSMAELFGVAFRSLFDTFEFDLALAVLLEQQLDVHLARRPGREVDERLIREIRETLQSQIPVSFLSTDVVIRSESSELPAGAAEGDVLEHRIHTMLRQGHRTAGVLLVCRASEPFTTGNQRMLEVLAGQMSVVLGNIRAHEQIQNLADTDDLTGIWNRRYFRRQLPSEVERSKIYNLPLTLLLVDVDDFKEINDTWGHTMGDVVLSELCGTIRETLRPPDLFARYGGDEFTVILPHTDLAGAIAVADRILQRVRQMEIPTENDTAITCSVSIGIASNFSPDVTAGDLTDRADERLYFAKRSGKNRYSY